MIKSYNTKHTKGKIMEKCWLVSSRKSRRNEWEPQGVYRNLDSISKDYPTYSNLSWEWESLNTYYKVEILSIKD